ncbi:MAG: anaerobic C4-dicarboxylate transporter family protein [Oligoflexales bacterium]
MLGLEIAVVLSAIFLGARLGGIGLGVMGGLGLAVLTIFFHLKPTQPPIDVLLMITAVVTATSALQTAGGLDYLVKLAERFLRNKPERITFYGPFVSYFFTFVAGTGHVAYSILPIIAEVARETGVRPERPLSVSVIASQHAITASPISAATVALLGLTADKGIELIHILGVCVPSTLSGVFCAAFLMRKYGKELHEVSADSTNSTEILKTQGRVPVYRSAKDDVMAKKRAKLAVFIFIAAVVMIVACGSSPSLRPAWQENGVMHALNMPILIEIIMLSAAALILLFGKVNVAKVPEGTVFKAGMQAVIAIFGIAWMGDTFFVSHGESISGAIKDMVLMAPWSFALALFVFSIFLFSQAATVRSLVPLGVQLGIPAPFLIAMFPAVNGYFFIPNYPTVVAAIGFDQTGTTRIGRYVLNHSFMLPGLVTAVVSVGMGFLISYLFL